MDGFFNSIISYFKTRAASAFIGAYVVFWLIYHWQFLVALLFVSQEFIYEKFGMLKNEYIDRYLLGLGQGIEYFLLGFIVPLLLTVGFIWILPKLILIHSYRAEIRHKTNLYIAKDEEERRRDSILNELNKQEIREEKQVAIEVNKLAKVNPQLATEQKYKKEFQKFANYPNNLLALEAISKTVYNHNGNIGDYTDIDGMYKSNNVSRDLIAIAHVNDLVEFKGLGNNSITLTKKGKEFLRQLIDSSSMTS